MYSRKSIEWFIEDHAFSLSYNRVRPHPHPPISSASCLSFSAFLYVAGRAFWRERGVGRGRDLSYDDEKAWSSINHSILSGWSLGEQESLTRSWPPNVSHTRLSVTRSMLRGQIKVQHSGQCSTNLVKYLRSVSWIIEQSSERIRFCLLSFCRNFFLGTLSISSFLNFRPYLLFSPCIFFRCLYALNNTLWLCVWFSW